MSERERFERFFAYARGGHGIKKRIGMFDRLDDGSYANESTQRHWWTWQNAAGIVDLSPHLDELEQLK